jgi:hypothetical protein
MFCLSASRPVVRKLGRKALINAIDAGLPLDEPRGCGIREFLEMPPRPGPRRLSASRFMRSICGDFDGEQVEEKPPRPDRDSAAHAIARAAVTFFSPFPLFLLAHDLPMA